VIPAMLGIYQFLTQTTFFSAFLGLAAHPAWEAGSSIIDAGSFGRWLRAYGPFAHPNIFGGYLVSAIIITDKLRFNRTKPFASCFMLHVSCLQWCALFFTFSRAAWLAAIVWLVMSMKHEAYGMKHIAYRVSIIAILVSLFFPLVQTRLLRTTVPEARSITERTSGYDEALALWRIKPLAGVGAGNYTIAAQGAFPNRAAWEYQPAHNVPLLMLAELGIIGMLLIASILYCLYSLSPIMYRLSCIAPLLPLLLFDHYLWSSHVGLLLLPIILSTIAPQDIPKPALDTLSHE
jgi:O-antigen ligase